MYRLAGQGGPAGAPRVKLLGSGSILREVLAAAELLFMDFGVASDIFSVTSFSELAREARLVERHNRYHPDETPRESHLHRCLPGSVPIVAATDYVRAYPELIAAHVRVPFVALGTDGFGRSDTRAALREFFEVDRKNVAVTALSALAANGDLDRRVVGEAMSRYGIDPGRPAPWNL